MGRLTRHLVLRMDSWVAGLAGLAWLALAIGLWQWWQSSQLNAALGTGRAQALMGPGMDERRAYAVGHLALQEGDIRKAAQHFTMAEAAQDAALRSRAKFALGNIYMELGLAAADVAQGGSHLTGNAQIELAREAYRGALRSNPDFVAARHNLELLDRLSPPRRTEGWERGTDGVTLAPQKRDGWASMKDNVRRGLP